MEENEENGEASATQNVPNSAQIEPEKSKKFRPNNWTLGSIEYCM